MYDASMMNTPNTITDLIDSWGKISEFARDVGCGYEAARQMRRRDSIAPEHWDKVVNACSKRGLNGVTYVWLLTIPGAQFEEAGTSGAVGAVRYRRPIPSLAIGA